MSWDWRRQDREYVLEQIEAGSYEVIATSQQGALDELASLSVALGVFDALELLKVNRERRGIPDRLLLRTLAVLPFVEAMGLSSAAGMLFQDAAILLQLGYTVQTLQSGFNQRRGGKAEEKSARSKPCHPEVLRDELGRIDIPSLREFQKACVGELFKRGLVKGKTYAIDGSGLGDGYRIVGLLNVCQERSIWISWRVLVGPASEKGKEGRVVKELVDQARELGGDRCIEWLLMDALYADGPLLAWLKYARQIDAMVRLPENRRAYEDLMLLVKSGHIESETRTDVSYIKGRKCVRHLTLTGVGSMRDWQSFREAAEAHGHSEASLWACAIHVRFETQPSDAPKDDQEWALICTRSFPTAWKAYQFWRQRWRIENSGFRELKEGWFLEKALWSRTDDTVIIARVAFTMVAYNVAQIAKTDQGRRLADRGIRRLRRELNAQYGPAPVVAFAGDAYGIFHIEEIMETLGRPPASRLHPTSSADGGLS